MKTCRIAILAACLASLLIAPVSAQTNQARLIGVVNDSSGAALPGVTVTAASATQHPAPVVTDGSGRYITPWMPPGTYTVSFELSGFEARTITNVALTAGQTIVLDQQLPLAALSETVQVTATAPVPPPPPYVPPPPPRIVPVDKEEAASVCGPRQSPGFSLSMGHITGHRDDPHRELLGPGDALRIDVGAEAGVSVGQNLVVRRRFRTGNPNLPKKEAMYGEQTAGLIQVVETQPHSSVAMVVYLCGEIYAGDAVERFLPQTAYMVVMDGAPTFNDPARIIIGEDDRAAAANGQMMVIDRGVMQGVQRGQRVTIFRRPVQDAPPMTIGNGVVIAVRPDSATFKIERSTDAVSVGDLVALHR
jgi:hypothetical protein